MTDKKASFNLRLPVEIKSKVEHIADKTNRSTNSMIIEMIESYSTTGSGGNKINGMNQAEYAEYLKSGVNYDNVNIFEFVISKDPESYFHHSWKGIGDACNVSNIAGCYALIDNGEILYVGSSGNLKRRMTTRKSNGWIASGNEKRAILDLGMKLSAEASVMFWFCEDYLDVERDLIYTIDPKFNSITPSHSSKSEFVISTELARFILSERFDDEGSSYKEKKSIKKLLSMKAYR